MDDGHYSAAKQAARANREFYRAFERLDIEAMRAVWLDDDSIQCVHPASERLVGRERVLGSWAAIFTATDAIRFELEDLTIESVGERGCRDNVTVIVVGITAQAVNHDNRLIDIFILRFQ